MKQPELLNRSAEPIFQGIEALGHCSAESSNGEDHAFSLVCLRWTCYGPACRSDCPYEAGSREAQPPQ